MTIPYISVDTYFTNHLSKTNKEKVKTILNSVIKQAEQSDIEKVNKAIVNPYFLFCPYCRKSLMLFMLQVDTDNRQPKYCTSCGESSPNNKIIESTYKAKKIYELINNESMVDQKLKRILMEQCIVILATSIEVYLKDIYSTILNMKYIKSGHTLIHRFISEAKNDFINMGKARKKFQSDLSINLSDRIGENTIKDINLLMMKRNVIVHNSGIIDKAYESSSGTSSKIGQKVPISEQEIGIYFSIIDNIEIRIGDSFREVFMSVVFEEANHYISKRYRFKRK